MIRLFATGLCAALLATSAAAQDRKPSSVEAKLRLERVAQCIVESSEGRSARLMTSDFTSTSYESGLKRLATDNRSCWRENRLRSSYGLPLAGALSEALLERDQTSLVSRVVKARSAQVETYATLDTIAICVVRQRPGITASLFGTEIGSDAEMQAVGAMADKISECSAAANLDRPLINIRYLLASASYRLVSAHQAQESADA